MSDTETETPQEPETEPAVEPQEEPQEPSEEPQAPDAEPDTEEPQEPAQEPERQTAPPSETPEALEKRARSAEQRFSRYARGIEDLYEGTGARLIGCPLCPDQHKGFVDIEWAGRIPEEIQANVKAYLGLAREIEYRASKRYHTCPDCDGEGKVETGSHVATARTVTCEDCKGYGYVPPPGHTQENGVTGPTTYTAEQIEAYSQAREDVDEWNEPRILPDGRENPNFGRMPNRKVLVEPWGVTAGLTALDVAR